MRGGARISLESWARRRAPCARASRPGTLTVSVMPSFAAKFLVPRLGGFPPRPSGYRRTHLRERAAGRLRARGRRHRRALWPRQLAGAAVDWLVRENLFPVCSPKMLSGPVPLATPADLLQHTLMHDSDWPDSMWPRWLSVPGVKTEPFKSSLSFNYPI